VYAKAAVTGSSPSPATVSFSGTGVQSQTVTTSGLTATTLLTSLANNLTLSLSPSLGGLDTAVLALLKTLISGAVAPVLQATLPAIVDPLLSLVGVRVGEVDISGGGTYLVCSVAGCVYADANHNVRQDAGETGTGATLFAKLVAASAPTVAQAVATVDPTTGNYSFPTLNPATYAVVISTSNSTSSVTPTAPAGWIGTESPTLSRSITVAAADLVNQRFGLFHGSSLAGTVFKDNGSGGGTANNGLKDGAETGLGGTLVSLVDAGAALVDATRSDAAGAYQLWIPYTTTGVLKASQAADPQTLFVAGKPGTTGGAFALAGAATSFTHAIGSVHTGVDFGDVPINRLDTDGQQAVAAGATALFPHVFHAGSAGQLTLSATPTASAPSGWSATTWLDANCSGQLDSGETAITSALAVVADQNVCVIVKVFVPQTASNETRVTYSLAAAFAYANSAAAAQATRQDLTVVGTADGLRLVKSVDLATATSGTVVTYTVSYVNQGAQPVTALKIRDATPAWTVMNGASCGSLPTGVTCSVSVQPAVGATGSVEWTLTGALASGATGNVVFSVKVQ
jgi:uncharacterized repeat protein (TIGR01451 family)